MNKRIILLTFFVMLLLVGCSKQEDKEVEKSVPVKIYKVKSESISKYIRVTGTVTADEDVIVNSKISERVVKVYVKPGQKVSKNQILAEQKNDVLKQGLDIANSMLRSAEAQANMTWMDFGRADKLYSEKAISQQQFDQAKTANETARQNLNQAKSAFEQTKEQYENSFIKAPFDGIVAAVDVEENQMINIGQPVVQVLSPSKMKAKIFLTGEDIQKACVGQNVIAKFPTIPGEEFSGKVEKVNSSIDQLSKSMEIEVALLKKDDRIKSGMFGEFLIETQNRANSLLLPETALLPQTEVIINKETGVQNSIKKYFLFVVDGGVAKLREVKTGIANDGQIEITSGLNEGDSIIIVGQNIVKEGQTVNVIE